MLKVIVVATLVWGLNVEAKDKSFHDFTIKTLQGKDLPLNKFKNKAVLIVNTASQCGYTGQYEGLEKLYKEYADKGLEVVGFPSNDFGQQEPGSNQEIATFCQRNYGVSFTMSEKVTVKGSNKTDLYKLLTSSAPEKGEISWNFEKFLVNKEGKVVGRYKSSVKPMSDQLLGDIKKALGKG